MSPSTFFSGQLGVQKLSSLLLRLYLADLNGAPDFEYVDDMFSWYEATENEINLKDFGYSEIQSHPKLYEMYLEVITRIDKI
jgi:hypothetical protein